MASQLKPQIHFCLSNHKLYPALATTISKTRAGRPPTALRIETTGLRHDVIRGRMRTSYTKQSEMKGSSQSHTPIYTVHNGTVLTLDTRDLALYKAAVTNRTLAPTPTPPQALHMRTPYTNPYTNTTTSSTHAHTVH